jgi:MFS transporter, ACS family, tartrate transporter
VVYSLTFCCRRREAKFLTADEKERIREELGREEQQKLEQHQYSVFQLLASEWHLVSIYVGMMIGEYALTSWAPQLVKSLSSRYSSSIVGLLVTIPYLLGLAALILVSRSSDRRLERRYHVAIPSFAGGLGLVLLGATRSPFYSVTLLTLLAVGIYSFYGPFWALLSEFLTGVSAAAGIALVNSVGNLGGFVGPYAIGAIAGRTGSFYGGLARAGVSMLVSATERRSRLKLSHRIRGLTHPYVYENTMRRGPDGVGADVRSTNSHGGTLDSCGDDLGVKHGFH